MQMADMLANDQKLELIETLDRIQNPKTNSKLFRAKLSKYNQPVCNIVVGFIFETVKGVISTLFGMFIMKNLFAIMTNYYDLNKMRTEVNFWCLIMFLSAITAFLCTFVAKTAFGVVGENITLNIRSDLYTEIIKKHIGWHDDSANAAGVLSSILASDVQLLNGASTEALAVMSEALFAVASGVIIGFIFSWRMALVALALTPFMMMGGSIAAKIDKQDMVSNKDANNADLVASDSIMNYRTVMAFGLNQQINSEFSKLIDGPFKASTKSAHVSGIVYGYSQFITNVSFATLFFFGTVFMLNDPGLSGENVFISIFSMFFGAFGAG